MRTRSRAERWNTLAVVGILALLAPLPAVAQEDAPGPMTWIAYSKVKPGQTQAAVQFTLEDSAFMDDLMADGTILSWGLATPINHRPGQNWNHAQWVTVPNWAAVDKWVAAVMQNMASKSEEERAAAEEKFNSIYEPGSHWDLVNRQLIFKPGDDDSPPAQYFMGGSFKAKPGKEEAVVDLFKEFVTPIADDLIEQGVLSGYGLYVQEIHGDPSWTHRAWYALPELGSIDKLSAAIQSAAGPAIQAWADAVFEPDEHSDVILMILHRGGEDASGGQ